MRIESQNSVQQFSALNAFRANRNPVKSEEKPVIEERTTLSAPKSLLERVDVTDIRKCAEFETSLDPPKPSDPLSDNPNHLFKNVVKVSTVVDDFSEEYVKLSFREMFSSIIIEIKSPIWRAWTPPNNERGTPW